MASVFLKDGDVINNLIVMIKRTKQTVIRIRNELVRQMNLFATMANVFW